MHQVENNSDVVRIIMCLLVLLTIVLFALKITNMLTISYVWVFSPLWLPFAVMLFWVTFSLTMVTILLIIVGIFGLLTYRRK